MSDYIEIGSDKALRLDEYKGQYAVSQHRKYEGKWYWQGVRVITGKDNVAEKTTPQRIQLGDRATAKAVLTALLREIMAGDPPAETLPDDGEGVPF